MRLPNQSLFPLLAVALLAMAPSQARADVDYLKDVKPLLTSKCGACHGVLKQEAGLRIDASQLLRTGGDDGPVIAAGDPDGSRLIQRISAADPAERMPPEGEGEPLKPEQVAMLRDWIAAGAKSPETEEVVTDPRAHWSFQPPARPRIDGAAADQSANVIDLLLNAHRRERGLTAANKADPATLLRRITFDLTGLPPTRDELHAFLADNSPAAYERLVDHLLASPAYGERWGRHWMDVWRYSDWDGFGAELRGSQKHIWHWRDWIIESLNADRPYDQMIREMLAGDEIAPTDPNVLRATGFLSRGYYKFNRQMWLDNVVEHTAKAFLGLTLNCAKCHDHKYDPLAQTDYYRFQAVFEPYQARLDRLPGNLDLEQAGLSRVFDAEPDAKTYLLTRGDERNPDKSKEIPPGVPGLFQTELSAAPVALPIAAVAPFLTGPEAEFLRSQVRNETDAAERALVDATTRSQKAKERAAQLATAEATNGDPATAILQDDFHSLDYDKWDAPSGDWQVVDGHLRQNRVATENSALFAKVDTPADFHATFQFKILGGQTYHSVGLSFDSLNDQNATSVYLSAHGPQPKVQVSFVHDGASSYPAEGLKALPIVRDRAYTLDVFVRGQMVNVVVDGELVVVYTLPRPRPAGGRFSVWSFDSQAEFLSLTLRPLAADIALALTASEIGSFAVTPAQAERNQASAEAAVAIARRKAHAAAANQRSFEARFAADEAKYLEPARTQISNRESEISDHLSRTALQAQHTAGILKAEAELAEARLKRDEARAGVQSENAGTQTAANEAQAVFAKTRLALEAARGSSPSSYESVAKPYPATSTGRRSALANWITRRDNPLAARVAVNHIWLRHFGKPLVENVFDFGLRSEKPRQAELLDWLAVELMDHGWSMKHIHRLIVMSKTYRLASAPVGDAQSARWEQNLALDPENADFWHAEVRRLDAEAIRDATIFISGALDRTTGGPDIDFVDGEKVPRRSVYFRHAYEKQMRFLTTFDAASPNECYRRSESIIPHQALAMANSSLTLAQSRVLAERLWTEAGAQAADEPTQRQAYVTGLFETALSRSPTDEERAACESFLATQAQLLAQKDALSAFNGGEDPGRGPSDDAAQRAREDLAHVVLNHNDFATVR